MTPAQQPLLVAHQVTVRRGQRRLVDGASLAVKAGELTVLMGPNGAGKTTLARAITGLIAFDGNVACNGENLATLAPRRRARQIAYLPQGHQFHWPVSVEDIVALGREPHADRFSQRSDADRAAVARAMEATSLREFATRPVTTLSGGERARVAIARALATEASILIADEPTAALDERHRLLVMGLLHRVAQGGAAVLAIIHDLTLAMRFADRVVLMNHGKIVADDRPTAALTPERIAEIFGISVHRVETPDGALLIPSRAV